MFLLFNAAQPYVYVIIGATVVVFAIVVIVFARLQKRPNNNVPDNIDESVDKAAEKIKETQPKTVPPAATVEADEHIPGEKPKETVVHVLYNHTLKTWEVDFYTEDEIVPHCTEQTKAEAIISARKVCDSTLWPLVIHNKFE